MERDRCVFVNNSFLSIPSAQPQELVTCTFWIFIIYIDALEFVFVISLPEFINLLKGGANF